MQLSIKFILLINVKMAFQHLYAGLTTTPEYYIISRKNYYFFSILLSIYFDFSLTVKAAPHECVIRTGQA